MALSTALYNMREDLFEREEDIWEVLEKAVEFKSAFPTYKPSRRMCDEDIDDNIFFPSYDNFVCSEMEEYVQPPTNTTLAVTFPRFHDAVERPEKDTAVCIQPSAPCLLSHAAAKRPDDDIAVRIRPSRQVDYLSNDWREEDLWSSWKHIISNRGVYNNSTRLENASWRCWQKKRSNLKTVPPESFNWFEDYDLTWLYGPFAPYFSNFREVSFANRNDSATSNDETAVRSKRPILKHRSLSEKMFGQTTSSSLSLRQSVAPKPDRSTAAKLDLFHCMYSGLAPANRGTLASTTTSRHSKKATCKKVKFHEWVEQFIPLANMSHDGHEYHYCCHSDDDVIVIRPPSKWLPQARPQRQVAPSKTIEKLPNAPLKYTEELEELPQVGSYEDFWGSKGQYNSHSQSLSN